MGQPPARQSCLARQQGFYKGEIRYNWLFSFRNIYLATPLKSLKNLPLLRMAAILYQQIFLPPLYLFSVCASLEIKLFWKLEHYSPKVYRAAQASFQLGQLEWQCRQSPTKDQLGSQYSRTSSPSHQNCIFETAQKGDATLSHSAEGFTIELATGIWQPAWQPACSLI